jgi:hypothetical protein
MGLDSMQCSCVSHICESDALVLPPFGLASALDFATISVI